MVESKTITHKNKNISLFGVTGLPWSPLEPAKHFGIRVIVNLKISYPKELTIVTEAYIMREQTAYSEYMSVRFLLNEKNRKQLQDLIRQHGFFPSHNARKYPRIPRVDRVQSYPLNVIGTPTEQSYDVEPTPIVFDVQDLSLGGVLVSTENPFALSLFPGSKVALSIEPRGNFSLQVQVIGKICRSMEERNPQNGNMTRYFGVRFTKVDDGNKAAFLELLRDILESMKRSPDLLEN